MKDIDQQWWLNNNKTNQQHQPMGPGSSNKTCSSSNINNNNNNEYLFSINEIISNTMHNCRSIISSEVKTIKPPPPPPPSNNLQKPKTTFQTSYSTSIYFYLLFLSIFYSVLFVHSFFFLLLQIAFSIDMRRTALVIAWHSSTIKTKLCNPRLIR